MRSVRNRLARRVPKKVVFQLLGGTRGTQFNKNDIFRQIWFLPGRIISYQERSRLLYFIFTLFRDEHLSARNDGLFLPKLCASVALA